MTLNKQKRLRINAWCKKFFQVVNNVEWRKNRNLHAIYLLDMLINDKLEDPYNKMPKDGPLPILPKTLIKSKLSKEFWIKTKYIYDPKYHQNKQNEKDNLKNDKLSSCDENNNNDIIIKLKNKRVKTPNMKSKNLRYFNQKKNGINIAKNENNLKKNKLNNNELENLRNTAIELEKELNKNEKIIEQQKEENQKLSDRIEKLNMILKSVISNDKI